MILDKIVERKRQEVKDLLANGEEPHSIDEPPSPPRGFQKALIDRAPVALIAEAKKASPSKGIICPDFDPAHIAKQYAAAGAHAISVLTDVDFFQGSLSYIPIVRNAVNLPVLRKDFIIHEAQVTQARNYGADAILLIAAILETSQIRDLQALAFELGMDVLVEVHDEHEAERSLEAGSRLIGVNNRNLQDFTVSLDTTFRVMKEIPAEIPVVSESGIRDNNDIERLSKAGVAAVLVGETLMRADDQCAAVKKLMGW